MEFMRFWIFGQAGVGERSPRRNLVDAIVANRQRKIVCNRGII
jgi:hypothetical protein